MNIKNITIGQAQEIVSMFLGTREKGSSSGDKQDSGLNNVVGKKCIIRTYSAGVWFGEIEDKDRNEVVVKNARRLWRWKASESISLSAVAVYGIEQSESTIAPAVPQVWLEAIELIPASATAIDSIEGAEDAKAR